MSIRSAIRALPVIVLLLASGLAPGVAPGALIHHWSFDEPDGSPAPQLLDSVGGVHGSFSNMTDANRSTSIPDVTESGRSLSFDGVNEAVTLPTSPGPLPIYLDDNDNFSVSLWYRGNQGGNQGGGFADLGYGLAGAGDGSLWAQLQIRNGKVEYLRYTTGWQHNIASTTSVDDDQWHHIAYVNHSNETGDLYIDGGQEIFGGVSSIGNDTYAFRVYSFMRNYSNTFTQGLLDDVRIYDHSLTQVQVTELFLGPPAPPVPEPTTGMLVGLSALGLTWRVKRKRQSQV